VVVRQSEAATAAFLVCGARMRPDATDFAWTGRRLKAAELVAADELTDAEIAAEAGINKATLERWKKVPAFAEKVGEARTAIAAAVRAEGIANKRNRLAAYQQRWELLEQVRRERGEHESMAEVPGGTTGILVRDIKLVKVLDDSDSEHGQRSYQREYETFAVDTPMLREWRELEKQMAIETGEWEEKQKLSGDVLVRRYVGVDPDDV
jgi:hypothetical protein